MPWGICFFNKMLSVSVSSVLLGVTEFVHMSGICHHSLMNTPVGHSGGFLGFVLMNDIAANILLPSPQGCSSEHIPESRTAASQGCVYSIAGHGQSSSKCWHQFSSHQQSGRVLVAPYPHQRLIWSHFKSVMRNLVENGAHYTKYTGLSCFAALLDCEGLTVAEPCLTCH